jgi:hypothetical protein
VALHSENDICGKKRSKFTFNRNIVGKITEAVSSMDRIDINEDESTTSTSRMTTPNQQISSYKNLSPPTPLSTKDLI